MLNNSNWKLHLFNNYNKKAFMSVTNDKFTMMIKFIISLKLQLKKELLTTIQFRLIKVFSRLLSGDGGGGGED